MSPLTGWRLPLRLARRDALRNRARSVLTLVMIALPVLAVTSADVLMQTSSVSGVESIDRRMGAAQASITVNDGVVRVEQMPDPEANGLGSSEGGDAPMASSAQVSDLLGGADLLELRSGEAEFRTTDGRARAEVTEVDLSDPLTDGLFRLESGRFPRSDGEVVVNAALAAKGYAVGDRLDLTADGAPTDPTIVGIAESSSVRGFPIAAGPLGTLGLVDDTSRTWLAGGGAVSWATVRQLNEIGATVSSRAVITDPPPRSEWPASVQPTSSSDGTIAIVLLIVVMALIEVVLLAGPAFAVGARKQQRSLALLVATGGTPVQSRRVVIASALVLGSVAAALGVVLGIGTAAVAEPLLQRQSFEYFGPFDVPRLHLLGIAAFGLLSAFLAALVPAWIASRQDVVAVLAGRRGDRAPSLRSPLLGVVLLGLGVAGSAFGAASGSGEILIAASAIPAVLGMVLLVPLVVTGVARLSGRLPLVLRYAARDAARHRTRTVPAVAAVAATVAGVVALGIGVTSDEAQNRETYVASLPDGVGVVQAYPPDVSWSALRDVVEREIPSATVTDQLGVVEGDSYTEVLSDSRDDLPLLLSSSSSLGSSVMVSDGALPVGLIGLSAAEVEAAESGLGLGRAVVFYSGERPDSDLVELKRTSYDPETGESTPAVRAEAPAVFVPVGADWLGPSAVITPAQATELGTEPTTVGLALTGATITKDEETTLGEGLAAVTSAASVYVERGYQAEDETVIIQLILVALGGVLMLGGTLTATFLALSDARPDLATLAAVGASPRTRRGVAAAYAIVVGAVGAALGAVVGFIPGIAITWPLTSTTSGGGIPGAEAFTTVGPFLDVPWLMILGLVVVLPLLTALIVGLFARSRLPLVARLD